MATHIVPRADVRELFHDMPAPMPAPTADCLGRLYRLESRVVAAKLHLTGVFAGMLDYVLRGRCAELDSAALLVEHGALLQRLDDLQAELRAVRHGLSRESLQ